VFLRLLCIFNCTNSRKPISINSRKLVVTGWLVPRRVDVLRLDVDDDVDGRAKRVPSRPSVFTVSLRSMEFAARFIVVHPNVTGRDDML